MSEKMFRLNITEIVANQTKESRAFVVNGSPTTIDGGLPFVICFGTRSSRFIASRNAGRILL